MSFIPVLGFLSSVFVDVVLQIKKKKRKKNSLVRKTGTLWHLAVSDLDVGS